MIKESEGYVYSITKAVDMVVAPTFLTSAIALMTAQNEKDLLSNVAGSNAHAVLTKMNCLEKIRNGKACHPSEWKIKFEPGKKCKGCYFRRVFANPKGNPIRCARIKRKMEEDPTSFPELRSQEA